MILLLGRYVGDLVRTQNMGYRLGVALVGTTLTITVILPSIISVVSRTRRPLVLSTSPIALTQQPGIIQIRAVQIGAASVVPTVAEVSIPTPRRASRGGSVQLRSVSILSLPVSGLQR